MKKIFTLYFVTSFFIGFTQQGINYKAIVKDNLGNVVSSTTIDVQFSILQGIGQTNVYQETHTPTTDANGIIILNIGEGTAVSGNYTTINWAQDDHFLNVQIDTGSGYIDLGTTQFMAVPYAITANSATFKTKNSITSNSPGDLSSDDFVFGSTSLDNISGTSDDKRFFFDKSKAAIRAGQENGTGWDDTNVGLYSAGFGFNTEASGSYSFSAGNQNTASGSSTVAFGNNTTASGLYSGAFGLGSTASGHTSFSFGISTNASGRYGLATGSGTRAESFNSTAIGAYNIGGGNASVWQNTDPLFEIGNGIDDANRSNALTILKNGIITAPSLDLAEITDNKTLTTKEYVDQNGSSGLEVINEGNGPGWRLKGRNPANYGNIGVNAIDLSGHFGNYNQGGALGTGSFAVGVYTKSMGIYSFSSGLYSEANTTTSHALGGGVISNSIRAVALGSYNLGLGSGDTNWIPAEPILEVGIGLNDSNRSNALTILKNGNVGITTSNPNAKLHVTSGADASLTNDTGFIVLGDVNGVNLALDSNEIMARNNGTTATLLLQRDGGDVSVGGTVVHSSDRRLKKDIENISYGLHEILQLQPKQYFWKSRKEQTEKSLGLIAQDVQSVIKSIVHQRNDVDKTLSVSYTELIPVLIKAIQEQQKEIETLKNTITTLEALNEKIKVYEKLEARISKLESNQ